MEYKNAVLDEATFGHVNVFAKTGGFCGGFPTIAEAKRWVDANQRIRVSRSVQLPDGRWRVATCSCPTEQECDCPEAAKDFLGFA